jgi:hypothetical protein
MPEEVAANGTTTATTGAVTEAAKTTTAVADTTVKTDANAVVTDASKATTAAVTETAKTTTGTEATKTEAVAAEIKFERVAGFPESEQARVAALAKALGLDQTAAQKLHDQELATFKADAEAFNRELAAKQVEFTAINKSHPTYGGAKFDETNGRINQLLAWGGEEGKALATVLDAEGVRQLPQIHNFLAKLAYQMADGKFITGTTNAPDPNRPATLSELYPTMK